MPFSRTSIDSNQRTGFYSPKRSRVVGSRQVAASASDPDFASVTLLLHMDGSNGSTVFIDSSSNPKAVTAYGTAQISTTQSKFGGSSGYFDGTASNLLTTDSDFALGTGDFTIELWSYPFNAINFARIIQCGNFGSGGDWQLVRSNDGSANFTYWFDMLSGSSRLISSIAITTTQWHHVAVTRSGSTTRMFINGVQSASGISSANLTKTTVSIAASENGSNSSFMYGDEVRITKGVARYTANFTPPTAAFPDS